MESQEKGKVAGKIKGFMAFIQKFKVYRDQMNRRMEHADSPGAIAAYATAAAVILSILMLFVPNYLGVADDGSLTKVMNSAGLNYIQKDVDEIYNNYFIRTYTNVLSDYQKATKTVSSHIIIVKAAVWLDNVITRDKYFDMRFLGLIYTLIYAPALWLFVKQACARMKRFSEGIVIGLVGILMFADISYITYFNSFYPEALWFIAFMYCIGGALAFQEDNSVGKDFACLMLILLSALVLISSRQQCAIIGILVAVYILKLMFIRRHWLWSFACVSFAVLLMFASLICMMHLDSDFDQRSKFHAMTRGVLFQSKDPSKTLEEFGIASSYEMLTDASSYDYLPLVKAYNTEVLDEGFYSKYSIMDIFTFYVKHPGELFSMLDVAVKASFSIRRSYCGNYEMSVGLPPQAKSLFWSGWSTFKDNSAPKTIGYVIILVAGIIMLFGKSYSLRPERNRRSTVMIDVMMLVLVICLSQAIITIVNSGDAELVQHCFLLGFGIDIMSYFALAEVLHKLNIL